MADRPPIVDPDLTDSTVAVDERPPIVNPDIVKPNSQSYLDFAQQSGIDEQKAKGYEDATINKIAFGLDTEESMRSKSGIDLALSHNPQAMQKKEDARALYKGMSTIGSYAYYQPKAPRAQAARRLTRDEVIGFAQKFKDEGRILESELQEHKERPYPGDTFLNTFGAYTTDDLPSPSAFFVKTFGDRAGEVLPGISAGVNGSIAAAVRGVQWLQGETGINVGAKGVADWLDENAQFAMKGQRPDFMTDFWGAWGSFLPLVTGGEIIGATAKVLGLAERLALTLNVGTVVTAESLMNAGQSYQNVLNEGKTEAEAKGAARVSFVLNMPLNALTSGLGMYRARFKAIDDVIGVQTVKQRLKEAGKETIRGGVGEFGQEGTQSIIGDVAEKKPINIDKAAYEGIIATFVGGPTGGAFSLMSTASQKIDAIGPMPEATAKIYDNKVQEGVAAGLSGEQANIEATQEIAKTPEGREYIDKVMQAQEAVIEAEAGMGKDVPAPAAPTSAAPSISDISAQVDAGTMTEEDALNQIMDRLIDPLTSEEGAVRVPKALIADEITTLEERAAADILEGQEGLRIERQIIDRRLQPDPPTEGTLRKDTERRIAIDRRTKRAPAMSLIELLRTDPVARQGEIERGVNLLTETGQINLQAEVALDVIRDRLSNFTQDPRQGIQDVLNIGRAVFAEGKAQVADFTARMQEIAGEAWESIKPYVQRAWNILANERGAIEIGTEGQAESVGAILDRAVASDEGKATFEIGKDTYTLELASDFRMEFIKFKRSGVEPEAGLMVNGLVDKAAKEIFIDMESPRDRQAMLLAHEIAHIEVSGNEENLATGKDILGKVRQSIEQSSTPADIEALGILPETVEQVKKYIDIGYPDSRLIEESYATEKGFRAIANEDIVEKAKGIPEGAPEINLEDRVQAIRNQARSKELPAFMEENDTWSEEEVDTALDKAQEGKPITEREAEIVHAALAEAGAQFYQEATGDEFITLEPDEINAIIEQGIQEFVNRLQIVTPVTLTAEQKKKKDRTKEFAQRGKEITNLQESLKETAYLLHQSVQDHATVTQRSKVNTKEAQAEVKRLESKIATRDKQIDALREKARVAALNIPKPLKPKAQIREATGQVKSPELRDLARSLLRQEGVARVAEREGRTDEAKKVRERIKDQMERARGKTDETAARNKLRAQIKKMLKTTKPKSQSGKPVGKFTPEVQRSLDKLREAANLSAEQADSRIAENLAKYPNEIPPDEIALENRVLSIVHGIGFYGQIYSDELAQIRDELREMIDEGRMMNELKKFNREAQVEKWVAEAVHVLTGGKGLPEGASAKARKANYDRIVGLTDRTKQWFASTGKTIVGFDDVMDILSGLDPSTPFESELNKLTDVMEAESAEKRGIKKALTRMQDMYMEAFGIEVEQGEGVIGKALANRNATKLMIEQMKADAQQIDLGTFTDLMGRRTPLEISRSEARKRYMELKDPSLADTFTEGMGYTNEMKQAILGTLTTRDRAFADAQLEFLQEYYDSINEVYRDLYGVDLPKNEFYSPIIREGFGRDASKGFGVMLEEINLRPSVTPSGAKSRTPNILPIPDMGDIAMLQRHMAEMEHFKAWAQRTKDLRAIFDNAEVRAAIELFHDPKLLGVIENFMAKFMRGGIDTSQNMDTLDKWRVNMARSVLAVKAAIGIKQLTSFVAYADAMPVAEFAKYSAIFWKNPVENAKTLYANSTVLAERGAHMERDIRDAQNTDEYRAFRLSPNFMNTLMLNIKMGDQGAIVMGGWPLYKYTLDQGATQEEAIRVFEKVTSGTQQSADLSQLSVWQSGNSFAKLFTTYKSSPNQYFRKELGALRNLMRGRQGVKKTAKTIFIFHMLLPMLFQFVSDGFEIDEEEQLRAIVLGPLNGVFIAGDILEQMIRAALGQRQFDSEIPMMSIGDDAGKAISALTSDDISSEDFLRAIRALAGVAGHVTGVPAKAGIDIGTGVVDIFSGDYERGAYEVLGWSPYKAKKASGEDKKANRRR